jgi:hypothetical protein
MACPICNADANVGAAQQLGRDEYGHRVRCGRCGDFHLSEEAFEDFPGMLRGDAEKIALMAFRVRRMQRPNKPPFITTYMFDDLVRGPRPTLNEQADNLIRWMSEQKEPGEDVGLGAEWHMYAIGAKAPKEFMFVVDHLLGSGHLEGQRGAGDHANLKLTMRGWDRVDELRRGAVESRAAFMAMEYGNERLDRIVNQHFRPAVAQTGFTLKRLDDQPKAGLIDDRLRVEIRGARFMVADLSTDNLGAYWEAGHAEGLGKPVIYTCEADKFEKAKTHFDTNHHLTVVWSERDIDVAMASLKATIRATLPGEAKLTDG